MTILVTFDSDDSNESSGFFNLNVMQQQQNSICRDCPIEYQSLKIDSPNRLVQSGVPLFRKKNQTCQCNHKYFLKKHGIQRSCTYVNKGMAEGFL